jgi:monoterpene epsilon-lactone hydrolase
MILSIVKYAIRKFQKNAQWQDIVRVRKGFDKIAKKYDRKSSQCRYEPFMIDDVKAEWIAPVKAVDSNRVLLYFHGGGYAAGSIDTHRSLISQIVKYSGFKALLIDYRLAPENKFPASIDDAVKAYEWLLKSNYLPERIAFGGDSAGGGLTVATLLYLRDNGMALPKCAICLSPWLDLTMSGESQTTNSLGDVDPSTPYASPIFADLKGLPPVYVQVGTAELLLDDSLRFAQKAKADGAPVTMDVYEGYFHVFQSFFMVLRTARKANKKLAEFIVAQIGA